MTGKNITSFVEKYGPWALVAGASERLGESYATALAKIGLNLVLVDRRIDLLQQLAERFTTIKVRVLQLDLSVPASLVAIKESTRDIEVGLLVYVADAASKKPFLDFPEMELLDVIKVNCIGPSVLVSHFGKMMRCRGKGGMIIAGSIAGLQSSPPPSIYIASKSFDLALAEGLKEELREYGIDVLCCVIGAGPEPDDVVKESLNNLGKTSTMIQDRATPFFSFVNRYLFSRKKAVRFMGNTVKKI